MVNSKAIIHDQCLEHENDIWDYVEMLGDQRVKNYETGRIEDLNLIIPILNGISDEVERYREFIQEVKMNNNLNSFETMRKPERRNENGQEEINTRYEIPTEAKNRYIRDFTGSRTVDEM